MGETVAAEESYVKFGLRVDPGFGTAEATAVPCRSAGSDGRGAGRRATAASGFAGSDQ